MDDTSPQHNENYDNTDQHQHTGESNAGDTSYGASAPSSVPQYQYQAGLSSNDHSAQSTTQQSTTSQPNNPQAFSANRPPMPESTAFQADTAPQYSEPQYDFPPQTQGNFTPQYTNNQSMGQGGTPIFPNGAPNQPYGAPSPNGFGISPAVPLDMPHYGCSFVEAIKRFFLKYVRFSGRASRSEYWWAKLFLFVVAVVLSFIDQALFQKDNSFLDAIWGITIFVPNIAIAVRRLHDSDKSGWWWLLPYGLYFAAVIILILSVGVGIGMAVTSNPSALISKAFGAGIVGGVIIALLLLLAGGILQIVLMVLAPDPRGARFDERISPEAYSDSQYMPMNGQYGQPMQQNPSNQAYNQSAPIGNAYAQAGNQQYPDSYQHGPAADQGTFAANQYRQAAGRRTSTDQPESAASQPSRSQAPYGRQSMGFGEKSGKHDNTATDSDDSNGDASAR